MIRLLLLAALCIAGCIPAADATVVVLGAPGVRAEDIAERVGVLLGVTVTAGPPMRARVSSRPSQPWRSSLSRRALPRYIL